MNLQERIRFNILYYLGKIDADEEFNKKYPDITSTEYLIASLKDFIKPARVCNILSGKAKRITLIEVEYIAHGLCINIEDLLSKNNIPKWMNF